MEVDFSWLHHIPSLWYCHHGTAIARVHPAHVKMAANL